MKKRLLSAFLALAMVLTLLPVSAFAAPAGSAGADLGQSVQYLGTPVTTGDSWAQHPTVGWYKGSGTSTSPYVKVDKGVVVGSSNSSGAWYETINDALAVSGSTITLIANASGDVWVGRNVTIDLHGNTLTGNVYVAGRVESPAGSGKYVANNVTSLTIQDTLVNGAIVGTVSGAIKIGQDQTDWGRDSFQLKLNNVAVTGAVDVFGSSASATVDNATTGALSVYGVPTSPATTSTNGSVTVTGNLATVASVTVKETASSTSATGGSVTVKDRAHVTGAVTVNATSGSTVEVRDSGTGVGSITMTQSSGGSIRVHTGASTGAISLNSTKGTGNVDPTVTVEGGATAGAVTAYGDSVKVNVNDAGRTGNVTVFGRATSSLNGADPAALIAPSVSVKGGTINGNIATSATTYETLEKDYTVTVQNGGTVTGTINLPKAQITVSNNGTVNGMVTLPSGTLTAGPNATLTAGVTLGSATDVAAGSNTKIGASAKMVVSEFKNTIGPITDVASNIKTISLTIPGATGASQNPRDNDTNRITSVIVKDISKWANSSIAGGHFQTALTGDALTLLTSDITYVVTETAQGTYNPYLTSYWGNTVSLINILANMTTIAGSTIATKDAPSSGAKTVELWVYSPRTQPDGDPANQAGPGSVTTAVELLKINFKEPADGSISTFILPSELGTNKSINWSPLASGASLTAPTVDATGTKVPGGQSIAPTGDIKYISNSLSYRVTKILDVQTAASGQYNATVKAKLVGNDVVLSGLAKVYGTGNSAIIPLRLTTDAMQTVTVNAVWNPRDKTLFFADETGNTLSSQTGGGLVIASDDNTYLRLVESNTKIGLKAGSLTEDNLKNVSIQGNTATSLGGMTTTTNKVADSQLSGPVLKQRLADALTVYAGTAGAVDFSLSPTVQQEFGAYIAKLNQTTLDGYLKKVQTDKYKAAHPNATQAQLNALTQAQLESTGYTVIAVVLYMNVDVTSFNRGNDPYTMTATMTPYARVEIQHGPYNANDWKNNPPVVVSQGVSLGTLDSTNVGEIKVTLPDVSEVFTATPNSMVPAPYAHQNATYVAAVDNTGTPAAREFSLLHTAANGAGFGTVVLSSDKPLAEVQKLSSDPGDPNTYVSYDTAKYYDTLQAAVDDAENGEKIVVDGAVGSTVEYPITVTGRARTIYIDVTGNRKITKANNSSDVIITQPNGNSTIYTVQLTKDNKVVEQPKPTEEVTISVVAAANGSAIVSTSKAKAGATVTVTVTPSANYNASGLTIRTDTGASVSYSTTGTNATTRVTTYTFVVPQGAKSITVTPAYVAVNTGVTITVSSTPNGTATTSAGTNKVAPGSTVSVSVAPSTGYRTMGLYVTSNNGTVSATRTGVNSFTFVVPANSTNVVVTPRFDVNNGTVFEDVWSTDYYSSPVAWAVRQGVTDGTSTYLFSPSSSCTRAQMVTFLWRAAGKPTVTGVTNPFWDVQPGAYYYDAVMWAVSKGITNGVSANRFGTDEYVTRAQAVTFLWRQAGKPAASTNSGFYDVPAGEYYAQAVTWAVGKGITNGDGSTVRFNPNGSCLRAQIVTFLYRNATGARA